MVVVASFLLTICVGFSSSAYYGPSPFTGWCYYSDPNWGKLAQGECRSKCALIGGRLPRDAFASVDEEVNYWAGEFGLFERSGKSSCSWYGYKCTTDNNSSIVYKDPDGIEMKYGKWMQVRSNNCNSESCVTMAHWNSDVMVDDVPCSTSCFCLCQLTGSNCQSISSSTSKASITEFAQSVTSVHFDTSAVTEAAGTLVESTETSYSEMGIAREPDIVPGCKRLLFDTGRDDDGSSCWNHAGTVFILSVMGLITLFVIAGLGGSDVVKR